jgi:2-polyprenyl-6-methoxyphenol hydroxylase-like FAD-dependent oxidoreductase
VMANGLNVGFRQALGITRREISKCHSITIGFDMEPVGRPAFEFPALTYYPERAADRMAYLTLFPIGGAMRANLMVYREMDDPWLRQLRHAPVEALRAALPRLARLTGDFAVPGQVQIRPADLYVSQDHVKAGIVLVGDAYATSCPAAGTGAGKVFTDVERLCNIHIPAWLATAGMGEAKIAAFYADPVKQAYDLHSIEKAYSLRSLSVEPGPRWFARRLARFAGRRGLWALRELRGAVSSRPSTDQPAGGADPSLGRPA